MKKKYYLFEMNTIILNVLSILILIIMLIITGFTYEISITDNIGLIIILMIPYMSLHEIIHSVSYVLNGADFKNITYGAHIEKGILCCLCKQNVSKRNILISLLAPFVIIGVITYIIGMILQNNTLIWLSIINMSGCSGDLMMFYSLQKLKNFEYSEYDNPIAFGLYTSTDLSKKKMFGLKYKGTTENLERNELKKITISKVSIICFIILIILGVLNILIK